LRGIWKKWCQIVMIIMMITLLILHQKPQGKFRSNRFILYLQNSSNQTNSPSLNTQSCIKGLLVVQYFCFWVVWAAGSVQKKSWENFLQALRLLVAADSLKTNPNCSNSSDLKYRI
jgi:hypothetical protein